MPSAEITPIVALQKEPISTEQLSHATQATSDLVANEIAVIETYLTAIDYQNINITLYFKRDVNYKLKDNMFIFYYSYLIFKHGDLTVIARILPGKKRGSECGFLNRGAYGQVKKVILENQPNKPIFALKSVTRYENELENIDTETNLLHEFDYLFHSIDIDPSDQAYTCRKITSYQATNKHSIDRREHGKRLLLMQFFRGQNVKQEVDQIVQSKLQPTQSKLKMTLQAFLQLLKQVLKLHQKGYIHFDIKADNIMVVGTQWFLIDFGLALRINEKFTPSAVFDNCPSYMAPELQEAYKATDPDKQTVSIHEKMDVYSLSFILEHIVRHYINHSYIILRRLIFDMREKNIAARLTLNEVIECYSGFLSSFQTINALPAAAIVRPLYHTRTRIKRTDEASSNHKNSDNDTDSDTETPHKRPPLIPPAAKKYQPVTWFQRYTNPYQHPAIKNPNDAVDFRETQECVLKPDKTTTRKPAA